MVLSGKINPQREKSLRIVCADSENPVTFGGQDSGATAHGAG